MKDKAKEQMSETSGKQKSSKSELPKSLRNARERWIFVGGRKQQERIVLVVASVFAVIVITLTVITEGAFLTSPWQTIVSIAQPEKGSLSAAINCRRASNVNTPYCRNRKARIRQEWESISKGGSKPFSLN